MGPRLFIFGVGEWVGGGQLLLDLERRVPAGPKRVGLMRSRGDECKSFYSNINDLGLLVNRIYGAF